MSWVCRGCCCFRRLGTASAVGATFTLVTSLLQILVTVAEAIGFAENYPNLNKLNDNYLDKIDPPTKYSDEEWIAIVLFIALACVDFIIVILSIIALFGVEPKRWNCWYFYPWIIFMPFYLVFDAAVNIYFFANSFQARSGPAAPGHEQSLFTDRGTTYGFLVTPLIYWIVRTIIILIFWFVVIFYCVEIKKGKYCGCGQCQYCIGYAYGQGDGYCGTPWPRPYPVAQPVGISCRQPQIPIYQKAPVCKPAAFKPGPYCAQRGCYATSGQYRVY